MTLVAGEDDGRIKAHRVVLAARSPWFEAMARRWNNDAGTGNDEIRIDEVNQPTLFFLGRFSHVLCLLLAR